MNKIILALTLIVSILSSNFECNQIMENDSIVNNVQNIEENVKIHNMEIIEFINNNLNFYMEKDGILNVSDIEYLEYEYSKYLDSYCKTLETDLDLETYSKKFMMENYGIKFDIPIYFQEIESNTDGVHTNGLFTYSDNEAISIIINPINGNSDDMHEIERTLIHELTHYYMYVSGNEFKDNTAPFELENFVNGGRSNSGTPSNSFNSRLTVSCCD